RVDNGTAKMAFRNLDLSALVSDALLPFEPVFFEKGLMLGSEIAEGISVSGSESHLKQIVDILLDNAQKYASEGAHVTVTLKRQDKSHCMLTVANEGEPIAPADLKKIFQRFYRVDKARSMNHSYGLGLSIAQSIAEQHGGKIWAESENGVNSFFVRLGTIN
ncbi:MAG: sensor histidine kinase, partial [Oscillospiraceae bacterium]|nr:sensor histidine kinase [Oscillospiraceae bacterium]